MLCPCGSEKIFSSCCQPLIMDDKKASSPEQLMRSRYSAFATKNVDYLLKTYTKVERLKESRKELIQVVNSFSWLKLVINDVSNFNKNFKNNDNAQVEFSAFYTLNKSLFILNERSSFIVENDEWRYQDGEILNDTEIVKPKKNDACFCGSMKKFKLCCLKNLR